MNKVFILVASKRILFTPPQIDRLAEIFLEIGKLITAGVVIGSFIPSSGVSTAQFWVGLSNCSVF